MNVLPQVYDYLHTCSNWYVFKTYMYADKDGTPDIEYGNTHINVVYLPLRRQKPYPVSITFVPGNGEYGDMYYFFCGNEDTSSLDIEGTPTWEDVLDHIYKAWGLDDAAHSMTESTFDWNEYGE